MGSTPEDRIDGISTSVAVKAPVKTLSLANITLSGEQTINGIALVEGDRILVGTQDDPRENGIYDVDTSEWQRAPDFDGNRDVVDGTIIPVSEGGNAGGQVIPDADLIYLRLDTTNDPLTGELQTQAVVPFVDATWDLGKTGKIYDRIFSRSVRALYEQLGAGAAVTANGSAMVAWLNNASATAVVSEKGSIAVVAVDGAADMEVSGIGSALFGQAIRGKPNKLGGVLGELDMKVLANDSWQFGAGTNEVPGELKVGAHAQSQGGTPLEYIDSARPGVRIADTGHVYIPDSGALRFGDGSYTQGKRFDASISWTGSDLLINPMDPLGATAGGFPGSRSVIISGSGQSGGDGSLELAYIRINSYFGASSGIDMMATTSGGPNAAALRFGTRQQDRPATTDPVAIFSFHYDPVNDQRLVLDSDLDVAAPLTVAVPIVNFVRTGGVQILLGDLGLADDVGIIFGAVDGGMIGTTATQKLALWGTAPIVQPTTAVAESTLVVGAGSALNDNSEWDGYTLGQVVQALRISGVLA
jgi:hypothetical protein